jgi:hypothetical protein
LKNYNKHLQQRSGRGRHQESRLSDFGGFSGINNLDHPYFQSNPVEFRYERVEGDLNTGSEPTRLVFENKPEGVHIGLLINNPGAITTTLITNITTMEV